MHDSGQQRRQLTRQKVPNCTDTAAGADLSVYHQPGRQWRNRQRGQDLHHLLVLLQQVRRDKTNAQARAHCSPIGHEIVGAQSELFGANRVAHRGKTAPDVLNLVVAHQRVRQKVDGLCRRSPALQVVAVRTRDHAHLPNAPRHQRALRWPHHAHCDIGLPAQQVAQGVADHQFDLYAWQFGAHLRQKRWQQGTGERLAGRDAHAARERGLGLVGAAQQALGACFHGARGVGQAVCGRRGHQTPHGALKQWRAQLAFQLRHMPAHGGLAQAQSPGGAQQTAMLVGGKKRRNQLPVEFGHIQKCITKLHTWCIVRCHCTDHNGSMNSALFAPSATGLHTILGANGVIGRELSRALDASGQRVRQVSRHPQRVQASDELRVADVLDAQATADAVAGSAVVYLLVGLAYDSAVWEAQWPQVMQNAMDACQRHSARLVFFDNVHAYGAVSGDMTENTPFNPCSRKGAVRAAVATTLLAAMARGDVQALVARSADFYGPGATNSLLRTVLFERLRAGRAPQWMGDPTAWHSFTYTPDAGRALAGLGQTTAAWGQTWHLPTSPEPMGCERMARLACELAGQPYRLSVMPRWLLKPVGWWVKAVRENHELMYQLNQDYRFSSRKIEKTFGLQATAYANGVAATLASAHPAA